MKQESFIQNWIDGNGNPVTMDSNSKYGVTMKINSGARWGFVTFSLGISCGILGHYLSTETAFMAVLGISFIFALFGSLAIQLEEKP